MKKKIISIVSVVVIGMIAVIGMAFANSEANNEIPRPLGVDPALYNENPAPLLQANTQLAASALIPEEKILGVFTDEAILQDESKPKTAKLTTWGEFELAKGTGNHTQIADERQVWVLRAEFSEYQDIRLGLVKDAQVTLVFDAETGVRIYKQIIGDYEKIEE